MRNKLGSMRNKTRKFELGGKTQVDTPNTQTPVQEIKLISVNPEKKLKIDTTNTI